MSLRASRLFDVAGKAVLVTGGGRGIGRMITQGFVDNGCTVFISARDAAALEETATQLNNGGLGRCVPLAADLSTRQGCEELAAAVGEQTDRLHVLVNNSGTSWGEPLSRTSGRMNWGWDKVLDVNLKAPFYLTRALLPLLDQAASEVDPSRVIMIGSVVGEHPQDAPTHAYDASKAGVHSLTRKLAFELATAPPEAGRRITVNAIAPGYVPSKMTEGLTSWGIELDDVAAATPMGRLGQAADMAGAALFLASPAAAWVTGAVLPVDGGILTRPLSMTDDSSL